MACGEATVDIRATAEEILEFVMDLRRYRRADDKVGPVLWLRRRGNRAEALACARVLGVPTPPAPITIELSPYTRLDVRSPLPGFHAFFECADLGGGMTRVRHRECLAGPLLGGFLQRSVEAELARMKALLEAGG